MAILHLSRRQAAPADVVVAVAWILRKVKSLAKKTGVQLQVRRQIEKTVLSIREVRRGPLAPPSDAEVDVFVLVLWQKAELL